MSAEPSTSSAGSPAAADPADAVTGIPEGAYRYWAFISYSHQDNLATRGDGSGDHVAWANWLHEQLETFVIPESYRDRPARTGEPMPERFFPAFRDEAELPTSHDLGGQIRDALAHSRFLIVIASPRSARSRYVNEEVRYFREIGRGDRILVLIVDGEPNVRLHPRAGWTAENDCFCPALVHPLRSDGTVDETQVLREEPIAADVRVKDSEPPREMRVAESSQDDRRGLLDFMKLKLIAGLMGVGLDELVQRDKQRAEEQERRTRKALSRTEFLFARLLLDLAERETGSTRMEIQGKSNARLSRALSYDPDNRAATVLGLERIKGRANRGVLNTFQSGPIFDIQKLVQDLNVSCDPKYLGVFARMITHPGAIFSQRNSFLMVWSGVEGWLYRPPYDVPCVKFIGHAFPILAASFSPDGERVITGSFDRTARLWETGTGTAVAKPLVHEDQVNSAVFSPDGGRILTVSGAREKPGCARLWDIASCTLLSEPFHHEGPVTSAVFSPDGRTILTASWDKTARLWDATTGAPLAEPLRHVDGLVSAVFSPDGRTILTASWDRTARLWDATTCTPLAEPLRHEDQVTSAVFSPDGRTILTASLDKTARLWDGATGVALVEPLRHEDQVTSAVFSPDGGRVLTLSGSCRIQLWDASSGPALSESLHPEHRIDAALFSPDGTRVLTVSDFNRVSVWDANSGKTISEIPLQGEEMFGFFWNYVCSEYQQKVSKFEFNDEVDFYNECRISISRLKAQGIWDHLKSWNGIKTVSADGERILIGSFDGTVRLWDAATGTPESEPLRHGKAIKYATFSPTGGHILTVADDNSVRLWDGSTGTPLLDHFSRENTVFSAVFSPDGRSILIVSTSGAARLVDTATGVPLAELLHHGSKISAAIFSPDGRSILTTSGGFLEPGCIRLWDADSCVPLSDPIIHNSGINSIVFNPEGDRILTVFDDHTARLGDAATGAPLSEPLRQEGNITLAVFSPDGARILTASDDHTTRLWDTATGAPLSAPLRHEDQVVSAAFSRRGGRILTLTDFTARLWDATTGELRSTDNRCLSCLLEAAGGSRVNGSNLLEPHSVEEIATLRAEFDSSTELDRQLCWWWSDPFTRPIHPSSAITVPLFVRRQIGEVLDWEDENVKTSALRAARDAFPHHPLVLLCDALAEFSTAPDPAWLRQYCVSRLLVEPHYLVPLEPPNALGDAKANRQYELTHGLAVDCHLGARLLLNDRAGEARSTDPERIAQARQLLARAGKLWPENEAIAKLAEEVGVGGDL